MLEKMLKRFETKTPNEQKRILALIKALQKEMEHYLKTQERSCT